MKYLLWYTLESPRRDMIIIKITSLRQLYSEYWMSTCGKSRKSFLDTTLIWNHMARALCCGGYSNKMSSVGRGGLVSTWYRCLKGIFTTHCLGLLFSSKHLGTHLGSKLPPPARPHLTHPESWWTAFLWSPVFYLCSSFILLDLIYLFYYYYYYYYCQSCSTKDIISQWFFLFPQLLEVMAHRH